LYLDDQLWQQALTADRRQAQRREAQDKFVWEERVLFHLIQRGIVDHDDDDKRWDGTTRAMRHTSAVGDRLWALLEAERARVSERRM